MKKRIIVVISLFILLIALISLAAWVGYKQGIDRECENCVISYIKGKYVGGLTAQRGAIFVAILQLLQEGKEDTVKMVLEQEVDGLILQFGRTEDLPENLPAELQENVQRHLRLIKRYRKQYPRDWDQMRKDGFDIDVIQERVENILGEVVIPEEKDDKISPNKLLKATDKTAP